MAHTVLYVEDNDDNALMIKMVLQREGATVLIAENGTIGLTLAQEHEPDLIICDYHLPGKIKGSDFIQAIRKMPALSDTPIIILTADTSTYPDSMEAGANLYLAKPVARDLLLKSVNSLL